MREKLAHIEKISSIESIKGADKVELAKVLGWQIIIKKGEFKVNDNIVYVEIDSVLPKSPWCEFLKKYNFKIKTIKLLSQIVEGGVLSQGIIFPLSILPPKNYKIGEDVTKILNIKHIDELNEQDIDPIKKKSKIHKYFMQFKLYRKIYFKFYKKKNPNFPSFLRKTDEDRLQGNLKYLELIENKGIYITEKIDGKSLTHYCKGNELRICSRNRTIYDKTEDFWNADKKYNILIKLKNFCKKNNINLAIQGELIGPKIQGNKYNLKDYDYYVFDIYDIDKQQYLNYNDLEYILNELELKMVPVLYIGTFYENNKINLMRDKFGNETHQIENTLNDFLKLSEGKSNLNPNIEREGIVVRNIYDERVSFKVINNNFLLENDK